MITDLKEAFDIKNLRYSWRWLNTNPDAHYKNYFRHIYRAYSISAEDNLYDLHKRLTKDTFQPTHATKLYLPKKSGVQRTYTLLTVEDQIVYQALINIVAEKLSLRVRKRYYREVFGNLYSGKRSLFFYRDWKQGHRKFGKAIRKVYERGFVYTASFDLTACYDSIDHNVLSHFLLDLGIQKEFVSLLCNYLKHWTATSSEKRIYQGHGIPQGPLSSGLLSEVVLRFFDENRTEKPKSWRYFRYVDDIRFFARNESDLRSMLIEMDLLSKQIGLFPQSSKIGIHKVIYINDEIKSVSHPPEPVIVKTSSDQTRVRERLKELSPRYEVVNETRFKYILGSAEPNATLSDRLIKILIRQPHLYFSIFNYFSRYTRIPRQLSNKLLELLRENGLYSALTAAGLRCILGRCHPDANLYLERFAKRILKNSRVSDNPELRAAAIAILLISGRKSYPAILHYLKNEPDWWPKSELIKHVQIEIIGSPSYEYLVNSLIKDSSLDVSIVAAEYMGIHSLNVTSTINEINSGAQLALKKMGFISKIRRGYCPISAAMQYMLGTSVGIVRWKKLLGLHYKNNISNSSRLKGYFGTDPTAWVNLLDTFHDDLLDSLFTLESGALGSYKHGNIGSVVNSSTSRFAQKYPMAFKFFKEIHSKRLESSLSHSVAYSTGKRTRFIEYDYIKKIIEPMRGAYGEIWSKWV